jgi:nitroreductase
MLDDAALDQLFRAARSMHTFTSRPVTDELIRRLYELMKLGPTAWNSQPGRYVFVRSAAAKARLLPHLSRGNRDKTAAAPVTVIVAYDTRFFERLPQWSPGTTAHESLSKDVALAEVTALRNSSLQGAYLILAARSLGLTAGPMSGFNGEALNREFFADSSWRANFLINLGYSDATVAKPRAPRVPFEDAVLIL